MALLVHDARLVTLTGAARRRGPALGQLAVVPRGWLLVEGEAIRATGEGDPPPDLVADDRLDADGRVVLPGFVDCHTHACWAGERLDEWEAKQRGASYLEILGAGGGIMSTVRSVREASEDELVDGLLERLLAMLRSGTTSAEVKSGYGLNTEAELRMLGAIERAGARSPVDVVPTACLGHAIDPDAEGGREAFIRRTIDETLPAVSERFPGIAVDAYCETAAWSRDDCVELFEAAIERGHVVRVHSDQFHALGMTEWAVANGARSVDHLEATPAETLELLARSETFGVVLPCSGFHVDGRYADARALVDAGGLVALGTNYNPGSSPCPSVPEAVALAVRHAGLTAAEAIAAATVNGAAVLGLEDRGRLEPGLRADLVVLRHRDERMLGYEFGGAAVDVVVSAGRVVVDAGS